MTAFIFSLATLQTGLLATVAFTVVGILIALVASSYRSTHCPSI